MSPEFYENQSIKYLKETSVFGGKKENDESILEIWKNSAKNHQVLS
jgi:hypothetical protein